ncbi:MAG: hypothetical protein QNL62_11980 [Gammaproteobacteria bacterium]|nr:hypothetical protein [Gammaproteobacteria bacterium]
MKNHKLTSRIAALSLFLLLIPTASLAERCSNVTLVNDSSSSGNTQPKPNLTINNMEKINRLLMIADRHIDVGRIVEPDGSSALFAYGEVLKIDPDNAQVKQGIQRIVEILIKRTQEI